MMNAPSNSLGRVLIFLGLGISALTFIACGALIVVREMIKIGHRNDVTIDWNPSIAFLGYSWILPVLVVGFLTGLSIFILFYMWCVRHEWFKSN